MKYIFSDISRSRWMYLYFGFYFTISIILLIFSGDLSKVIISMMNIILILAPLIAIMFGLMYFFNSSEFILLLLAQPISRVSIFLGLYFGLALALCSSVILGLGIPFIIFGVFHSPEWQNFLVMMVSGIGLTMIFTSIAFLIAIRNENKIRGFAIAIFTWLFFAIIYDGIILMLLLYFRDYPLEQFSLVTTFLNPIDLSRIMILLKLDISALMGYTGAVFHKFFGSSFGLICISISLLSWVIIPTFLFMRSAVRKDF